MSLQNFSSPPPSTDRTISQMWNVSQGLMSSGEARERYSQSWSQFADKLSTLVETQTAEYSSAFSDISEHIKKISEIHRIFSAKEKRSADDFRDIIERYYVVNRANAEYQAAKASYTRSGEALINAKTKQITESAKPTYERNKFKIEANIAKAKDDKQKALNDLKEAVKNLIEVRKRYDVFKVRRMVSCWKNYGQALKEASLAEKEEFQQLRNLLSDLKSGNVELQQAAEKIEGEIAQHMNENPAPSSLPDDEVIEANPQYDGFD